MALCWQVAVLVGRDNSIICTLYAWHCLALLGSASKHFSFLLADYRCVRNISQPGGINSQSILQRSSSLVRPSPWWGELCCRPCYPTLAPRPPLSSPTTRPARRRWRGARGPVTSVAAASWRTNNWWTTSVLWDRPGSRFPAGLAIWFQY